MNQQNWLTQAQLAQKYGADEGTVSQALSLSGVITKGKKTDVRVGRVFPEYEAAGAIINLFLRRAEEADNRAEKWRTKARKAEVIFEEGQ